MVVVVVVVVVVIIVLVVLVVLVFAWIFVKWQGACRMSWFRTQAPKKYTNLLSDDINTALIYFKNVKMPLCN